MRYLLDTNILSSIVVASELRYGARKKGSARLEARVEAVLPVLPLEGPLDTMYAETRCRLEEAGIPIGAHDLLIAAQTLAADLALVTDETREFQRVKGLRWENWLRPSRG